MSKNKKTEPELTVVAESDEQAQEIRELIAAPTPEAVAALRERYGLAITVDGEVVEVKEPVLRKAREEGKETGKKVAGSIKETFDGTGETVAYALVDVPVEAMRTAKEKVSEAWEQRKANFRENHRERMQARQQARLERKREKAAEAEAKRREELERLQAELDEANHTTAS